MLGVYVLKEPRAGRANAARKVIGTNILFLPITSARWPPGIAASRFGNEEIDQNAPSSTSLPPSSRKYGDK